MPRHPLHAPLVHFPLALLGTSLVFDVVGIVRGEALWWAIGFWNVALGLTVSVATAVTGFVDSLRVVPDSPASPIVTRHMLSVLTSLSCYGAAMFVRGGPGAATGLTRSATLALEAVGFVLLMLAGWLGGEMVYRHGVGRMS